MKHGINKVLELRLCHSSFNMGQSIPHRHRTPLDAFCEPVKD